MKANPLVIGIMGITAMITGVGSLGLSAFFAIGASANSYLAMVLVALLWTAYFLISRGFRLIYSLSGVMTPEELDDAALKAKTVEDRLDELERLKRRDMVTPEEYAAKRGEILKDL